MSVREFSKTFSVLKKHWRRKSLVNIVRNFSDAEITKLEVPSSKKARNKRNDRHVTNVACAQSICQLLPKNCELVLEGTPGVGVLTEALLRSNDKLAVRVYETLQEKRAKLMDLQQSYGEARLQLIKLNFWNLSSHLYKDRVYGTTFVDDIFKDVAAPRSWNHPDPPFVMLGPIPTSLERTFAATLPPMLCEKSAMFAYGRVQFMIYVSEHTYRIMTATSKDPLQIYQKTSVLFNLLFHVQLLAKESLSSFSAAGRTDQMKLVLKKYDEGHLYLLRVTPKAELDFQLSPNVSLKELLYFVRQTFSNRSSFVIDKIDSYIPRAGPRLIDLSYTTTTRFGDLNPIDVAHLFREFSSWPEYEHSNFKNLACAAQEQFDSTAGKE